MSEKIKISEVCDSKSEEHCKKISSCTSCLAAHYENKELLETEGK
jgi:hypothetical protein